MKANNTFGHRLKLLRVSRDLKQEDLGEIIRVTKSTVSKYERNELQVNYETAKIIAEYFNVSTDYLLGIEQTENAEAKNPDTIEETYLKQAIQEYRELIKILDITEIEAIKDMKGRGLSLSEVNKALKNLLLSK